jgi:hypothetical protein
MPTYLLIPLHTSERAWSSATRRDPIQVVAKSEQEARIRASLRYGVPSGGDRLGSVDPWLHSKWTYVHVIENIDRDVPLLSGDEAADVHAAAATQPALAGTPSASDFSAGEPSSSGLSVAALPSA